MLVLIALRASFLVIHIFLFLLRRGKKSLIDGCFVWRMRESEMATICQQVLSALAYLHSHLIIHRFLTGFDGLVEGEHWERSHLSEFSLMLSVWPNNWEQVMNRVWRSDNVLRVVGGLRSRNNRQNTGERKREMMRQVTKEQRQREKKQLEM